jgi:antitoxin component of MazEF toxin-antitoxin module
MAMDAALERDVAVEMTISKGVITVVRVAEETPKLAAMLAAITDDNLHGEVHWGPSVGNEAW